MDIRLSIETAINFRAFSALQPMTFNILSDVLANRGALTLLKWRFKITKVAL